jgi:hypothetical protein
MTDDDGVVPPRNTEAYIQLKDYCDQSTCAFVGRIEAQKWARVLYRQNHKKIHRQGSSYARRRSAGRRPLQRSLIRPIHVRWFDRQSIRFALH